MYIEADMEMHIPDPEIIIAVTTPQGDHSKAVIDFDHSYWLPNQRQVQLTGCDGNGSSVVITLKQSLLEEIFFGVSFP